jgi:hypothetical protein
MNPPTKIEFESLAATKRREEEKRDRVIDPVKQWKALQQMITWMEANLPYEQRRNRPRIHPSMKPKEPDAST